MLTKRLELQFTNVAGKRVTISVIDPKDDLTSMEVEAVMNQIIAANIIEALGGDLVAIAGARVVTREVAELVAA